MNFTEKQKKQILKGFVGIFTRIADKGYQKRVWINGVGPEVDSFEDIVCDFLGECDSILENHKYFGISELQYKLLKSFSDKFEAFSDENDFPEEFIDTPEWEKIIDLAREVLKAFIFIC